TSCMIPAIEYYAAGIPLTTDQIKSISRPLMDALKLGGGFPRTMADDYLHTRCMYLQAPTTQAHGYTGDILAYPHIPPETMARSTPGRPGIGQT
ncbi:hypothetical protein LPJ61_005363, partial [Coemansia biformis]